MLAVSSGHNNVAALAFNQGDCPPADAGSSVRTKNHAAGSDDHVPLKSRSCHQPAANSTAADAATAQLKESSILGSQQGDYSATDALISPVAAKYAQGIAAADLFSTTSRAAATATDRLKESPVCGPKQGDYSATDALSPTAAAQNAQEITAAAQNDFRSLAVEATTARSMEDPNTARLMESPPSVLKQGDCSAADTGRSARQNTDNTAAKNAQDLAAAQQNRDSLAAATATAQLKESPASGSEQGDCPTANAVGPVSDISMLAFGSIIRFLLSRFKFPLYDFRTAGLKFGMASISF